MKIPNAGRNMAMLAMTALLSAASAHASILIIDQFGDDQHLSVPPGTFADSNVSGSMLGGFRYASITQTKSGSSDSMDVNSPIGNELDFHNSVGSIANLVFFYDGTSGTSGNPAFGLNSDLTGGGGNNQFDLNMESDHAITVKVDVYSGATGANQSEATYVLSNDGNFHTYSTLFTSFATVAGTGANFASVSTVKVTVLGVSQLDMAINGIDTSGPGSGVPEPASLAMIGGGLVGLGLLSRKRFNEKNS